MLHLGKVVMAGDGSKQGNMVEVTPEMIGAGMDAYDRWYIEQDGLHAVEGMLRDVFMAMLMKSRIDFPGKPSKEGDICRSSRSE